MSGAASASRQGRRRYAAANAAIEDWPGAGHRAGAAPRQRDRARHHRQRPVAGAPRRAARGRLRPVPRQHAAAGRGPGGRRGQRRLDAALEPLHDRHDVLRRRRLRAALNRGHRRARLDRTRRVSLTRTGARMDARKTPAGQTRSAGRAGRTICRSSRWTSISTATHRRTPSRPTNGATAVRPCARSTPISRPSPGAPTCKASTWACTRIGAWRWNAMTGPPPRTST